LVSPIALIKAHKLHLASDRIAGTKATAYWLMHSLRDAAPSRLEHQGSVPFKHPSF
jgi:hypothetical protein